MTQLRLSKAVLSLLVLLALGCGDPPAPDAQAVAVAQPDRSLPPGGFTEILEETDVYRRVEQLARLLGTGNDALLPDVKASLENFRIGETPAEFGLLMRFWAEREPEAAAAWSLEPARARFKISAVLIAFDAWGETDPTSAIVGIQQTYLQSEEVSRTAQMALIHGWYRRDAKQLLEYIRSQSIGIERQRSIYAYALSMASEDGSERLQSWAESYSGDDDLFRIAVLRQSMNALTVVDRPAAIDWCDRHCGSEWGKPLRKALLRARIRGGDAPPEVLEWAARLDVKVPPTGTDLPLLRFAYANWKQRDQEAAFAWLRSQVEADASPDWLVELYPTYATQLALENPQQALDFIRRKIVSPTAKERAQIGVARAWSQHDSEAALRWLESSPLSEAAREKVRNFESRD